MAGSGRKRGLLDSVMNVVAPPRVFCPVIDCCWCRRCRLGWLRHGRCYFHLGRWYGIQPTGRMCRCSNTVSPPPHCLGYDQPMQFVGYLDEHFESIAHLQRRDGTNVARGDALKGGGGFSRDVCGAQQPPSGDSLHGRRSCRVGGHYESLVTAPRRSVPHRPCALRHEPRPPQTLIEVDVAATVSEPCLWSEQCR